MDYEQGGEWEAAAPADSKNGGRRKANMKDSAKEDRLPPHSIPAEQGVIGSILLSPTDCIGLCIEKVKGGSLAFYDLRNRLTYEAILSMHADGWPIDIITLQQELKDLCQLEQVGGLAYLASLPDCVPSAANLEYYIAILNEKHLLRSGIALATEFSSRAYDHRGEASEAIVELERDVRTLADGASNHDTLFKADALVQKSIAWMERSHQNQGQPSGILTGFVDFDMLTGGLQFGELTIIAARPSVGKSSWCMNVADYVAVNLSIPVCVFSLEMSSLSLMNRTICSRARVSFSKVRDGQLSDSDFTKLAAAAAQIHSSPLFIDDGSGTSIAQLMAKARRMSERHGVRLFVVDYLQLLSSSKKKVESRQQEIAEISAGLKTLSKELDVPVVVASQLNREIEKDKKQRRPRMADIRESGAVEQDADMVAFLYRQAQEDDGSNNQQDSVAIEVNLLLAKNRNGRTGEIPLTFLKPFTRFESAAHAVNQP